MINKFCGHNILIITTIDEWLSLSPLCHCSALNSPWINQPTDNDASVFQTLLKSHGIEPTQQTNLQLYQGNRLII